MHRALVVASLWLLSSCSLAASAVIVNVKSEKDFQLALADPSVHVVVLEQDLLLTTKEQWSGYSSDAPLLLTRNLTITSSPILRKLDFSFVGDGQVQLAPGILLNITYTVLQHARYGAGVQLDFLAPSPGSYLVLWNSVIIRTACVSSKGEPDAVAVQPRLSGLPGQQRASYRDGFCLRTHCYDHVLLYEDFTKVTSTSTEDTAAGGYAIVMHNFTKVCLQYLEDTCNGPSRTVDDCVRDALDRLSAVPTPGQVARSAAAAKHRVAALAAGLAVGLGGAALLLLLLAVLLLVHCRRLRHYQPQLQGGLKLQLHCSGSPGSTPDPKLKLRVGGGAGGAAAAAGKAVLCPVVGHLKAALACTGTPPPDTHNSWELAASRTSARFLHQQQHSSHQSSAHLQQYASMPVAGTGWYMRSAAAEGSTADLIAGTDGAATDSKVTLGVLLGAGSFGRVYRGCWRGMGVAVKVLHHSGAAASSVANEIDLMMSFAHPHVVSAHHFVTWKKHHRCKGARSCSDGDLDAILDNRQQSVDNLWAVAVAVADADGATSAELVGPQGELPDDMQTWIVQEYCGAGSLSEYCLGSPGRQQRHPGQLPEGHSMLKLLFRLREVADGMSYLHSRDVVHGDLKGGNVLLCVSTASPYGRMAKVTDFGLSRALGSGQTHRSTRTLGTVSHMAPELLRFGKMSPAVDVYSFGIMMWELLTGRMAFQGLHYGAIIEHVALLGHRPPMPEGAPEDLCLLMSSCWLSNPQQRPTFEQVIRCLDIMISCRQQELVEAKSGSSLTAEHSGSGWASGLTGHQHISTSSGEFDLVVTTSSGNSRLLHMQQNTSRSHAQQPPPATGQGKGVAAGEVWRLQGA